MSHTIRRPARALSLISAATISILMLTATPSWALTGTWTDTAGKPTPRYDHVAARLSDGRVLVTGGLQGSTTLKATDIYNPATDQWTSAAPLLTARSAAAAVTLADGRVLVAGGTSGLPGGLTSTEIYSPRQASGQRRQA